MLYPKFKIGEVVKIKKINRNFSGTFTYEEERNQWFYEKWENFLGIVVGNDQEFCDVHPVRTIEFIRPKFGASPFSYCFRYEELIKATEQERFLYYIYGSEILVEENAKIC